MNAAEFVKAIRIIACDSVSKGVMEILHHPPGRTPQASLVRLSEWFHRVTDEEKQLVRNIIELAADQAVYNVLLALDGFLAITPAGQKGELELLVKEGANSVRLNDPAKEPLSALFKGNV